MLASRFASRLVAPCVTLAVSALALIATTPAANAQITFFTNRTTFTSAVSGLTTEGFEGTTNGTNRVIFSPISSTTAATTMLTVAPGITVQPVGTGSAAGIFYNNGSSYNTGNGTNVLTTNDVNNSQDVTFSSGVDAYGVDLGGGRSATSGAAGGTYTINIFDTAGSLLGTTTSATAGGTFSFVGFTSTSVVGRVNIAAPGYESTDNMTFRVAPAVGAPEPGSLSLLGIGLAGGLGMVGTVRRRKAAKQAVSV